MIPSARSRYLAEIADTVRGYHQVTRAQADIARRRQQLSTAAALLGDGDGEGDGDGCGRGRRGRRGRPQAARRRR